MRELWKKSARVRERKIEFGVGFAESFICIAAAALASPLDVVAKGIAGFIERQTLSAEGELDELADVMVEHCGWLLKEGRAVKSWKLRWTMLQASCRSGALRTR